MPVPRMTPRTPELHAPKVPSAAELLVRLCSLVALQLAHLDHHPEAYDNPSGQLLAARIRDEARRIFRSQDTPDGS